MARITHSHSDRARARLISTPHEGNLMSNTTTVVGVKFSDQLAALLDHALAHGFRVEPDTTGTGRPKANAVVIYPPDKNERPVRVQERGAKYNKAHYENLRRELYQRGLEPLPAENGGVVTAPSKEAAEAQLGHPAVGVSELMSGEASNEAGTMLIRDLAGDDGPSLLADVVHGIARTAKYGDAESHLIGVMVLAAADWAKQYSPDRLSGLIAEASEAAVASVRADVDAALAMASEHEATAARATEALARAEARETKAREDCARALAEARAEKARADELEAAIAPLRALLGKNL